MSAEAKAIYVTFRAGECFAKICCQPRAKSVLRQAVALYIPLGLHEPNEVRYGADVEQILLSDPEFRLHGRLDAAN